MKSDGLTPPTLPLPGRAEELHGGEAAQYVGTNTYSRVQTTSEPRMPIGMSRFGPGYLRGSRHGVEADEREEHHACGAEDAMTPL